MAPTSISPPTMVPRSMPVVPSTAGTGFVSAAAGRGPGPADHVRAEGTSIGRISIGGNAGWHAGGAKATRRFSDTPVEVLHPRGNLILGYAISSYRCR